MKRLTVFVSVLILGVLLSVFAYSENTPASDTFSVNLQEGNTFPVFTLETLNGKKTASSKAFDKNKKTLIVTAAEWCPDCHEELPVLEKFYRKNKNNNLRFQQTTLAINVYEEMIVLFSFHLKKKLHTKKRIFF